MPWPEQRFRWTWVFKAPPEALWPLVSNTDRFNRDCGFPPVVSVPPAEGEPPRGAGIRRLRATASGAVIEWDEREFEWVSPRRFAVDRTYLSGPVSRMLTNCELEANPEGGTSLVYEMRLTPSGLFGRLMLPYVIGRRVRATIGRVLGRYDGFAVAGMRASRLARKPELAAGGADRLDAIGRVLVTEAGQPERLVGLLTEFVRAADDLAAARIRPYLLADDWKTGRRETLDVFLHATRAGLLDFSWDLICPHCRGSRPGVHALSGVAASAHCDSCDVDFTANFDQSVELTFAPNSSVRPVVRSDYCVGGPQVTPHIVAQKRLGPGQCLVMRASFAPGRYRIRSPGISLQSAFRVDPDAPAASRVEFGASAGTAEPAVAPEGELVIANADAAERLAVVESIAWSDQATTAADVTSRQLFRDLFSREVLRQGEQISVGAMTVVFTDLKNSTQMYVDIGDAPAFGRVLTHFDILKAAVDAGEGCLVKTMGDAVMAVFTRPVSALRAIMDAQRRLARPPAGTEALALKCGIHSGPCLAINQNERLDYFGTTVNIAARLCSLSTGADIIVSQSVRRDPEVNALLEREGDALSAEPETALLKGFSGVRFEVCRVARRNVAPAGPQP